MPAMSGLQVQAALRARGNEVPIVFISAHADVPVAVQAMKEGAIDLLEKPFSEPVLLETVQRVVERDRARRLQQAEKAATRGTLARLTGREMEVVRLVAKGKSSKEIAAEMRISRRTVEVHRCRAIRKAGARNTAELVQMLTRLPVLSASEMEPSNGAPL
jgi:FixJ family two-component response regulator